MHPTQCPCKAERSALGLMGDLWVDIVKDYMKVQKDLWFYFLLVNSLPHSSHV